MLNKLKSLIGHQGFRKYFFNTGWLMADKIVSIFFGLFIGIWVARYLGPGKYGLLNFAISFVSLFSAVGTLGLDEIIVRNIIREPESRDNILGTSFFLRLFSSILLLIFVFVVLEIIHTSTYDKIIVMIIAFGQIFTNFNIIDYYFQSQVKAKFSGISNVLGRLSSYAARVIFIVLGMSVIWFAVAVVIEQLIKGIFLLYFYLKNKLSVLTWKYSKQTAKNLLKDSWSLIASGIAITIYMGIDQVMIKEMLNNKAVGEYAVAVKLSTFWYFIPMVISSSIFPAIVNAKKQNSKLYFQRIQKVYDLFFLLSVSIALATTFLSGWIVNFLYGSEYVQAAQVLQVYIWAGIIVFHGTIRGNFLITENMQKVGLQFRILGAILNILLNIFFIKYYGIIGAAYATIISYVLPIYLLAPFYSVLRKELTFTWNAYLFKWLWSGKQK
jgi:O-antigen/teichoic acid export membrane protein